LSLSIGVDVGGTKVLGGVVDENGKILKSIRVDTPKAGGQAVTDAIAGVVKQLADEYKLDRAGIAVPGYVSNDRQNVLGIPNIKDWQEFNLRNELSKILNMEFFIENDANAAAWAEYRFGAGIGESHVIILTIGTGLGGGIIIDGELFRGAHGTAAEFGHLRVVPNGVRCGCGVDGCFERYASGTGLMMHTKKLVEEDPYGAKNLLNRGDGTFEGLLGKHITEAALEGDQLARQALAITGHWIGAGISSLAAILDPELVIIGGGVVEAGDLILEPARQAMNQFMPFSGQHPHPRIVSAKLLNDAGLVGAADLARASK
jgi:glucokinase